MQYVDRESIPTHVLSLSYSVVHGIQSGWKSALASLLKPSSILVPVLVHNRGSSKSGCFLRSDVILRALASCLVRIPNLENSPDGEGGYSILVVFEGVFVVFGVFFVELRNTAVLLMTRDPRLRDLE